MAMFESEIKCPTDITPDYNFYHRLIVATGHRPQKTGGFSEDAQLLLKQVAVDWLAALKPRGCISGMALGWDTAIVHACLNLGLPYVACIPFRGQESQWPLQSRREYANYIRHASKVIVCSPGGYSPQKMQIRNERMVDIAVKNGDPADALVLAMWDGTSGGTRNCLYYSRTRIRAVNAWSDLTSRPSFIRDRKSESSATDPMSRRQSTQI